jgi:hypothetical protein
MTKVVQCDSCGAVMRPTADGRVFYCDYCRSHKQVAIDEEQLAQGLALDMTNVHQFLHDLSAALHHAFPDKTRVSRVGHVIELIELNLDPHLFIAKREHTGEYSAHYKKLVRGVALKTKVLTLDVWVKDLTKSMAEHANNNARVASVLARLRGGQ